MFQDVLIDYLIASILILIGVFLRSKIKVLQRFFIPVAVIAGFVGLLIGPEVLGRFSPVCIHWSEYVSQYANPLLAILFVTQFLCLRVNTKMIKKCSMVFLISSTVIGLQIASALPLARLFHVPDGFALLPFLGFYGAHGLPSLAAGIYENVGYWSFAESNSVGATFATIGMLWGIIVGIVIVNIAVRKKWLANENAGSLTQEELTGVIKEENREKFMLGMTASTAVTPLAFHVAIIGAVMYLGYLLLFQIQKIEMFSTFAITIPAVVVALLVDVIAAKTGLSKMFDEDSLNQIGNTALEYLIVTSIANTNITVVLQYAVPILVMACVALALTTIACVFLSKLWLKKNWVENAMVMFGSWTGSTATGLMLLKVCDPELKTDAGQNLITATPFWQLTTQSFFMMIAPYMIVTTSGANNVLALAAALAVAGLIGGTILNKIFRE